jgi:adenylate kinase family enzyme
MKLWIVGPPGSGKSILADRLGALLSCPVVHLDEIHWLPGWQTRDPIDFREVVDAATAGPAWVVDGNYQLVRRPFLSRADRVIWLDLPLSLCLRRLVRRCLSRAFTREIICNGNRESLRETFLSRKSLLWWAITTDRERRRTYTRELSDRPHDRLRSCREIEAWLVGSSFDQRRIELQRLPELLDGPGTTAR